jgi:hypothetical protein
MTTLLASTRAQSSLSIMKQLVCISIHFVNTEIDPESQPVNPLDRNHCVSNDNVYLFSLNSNSIISLCLGTKFSLTPSHCFKTLDIGLSHFQNASGCPHTRALVLLELRMYADGVPPSDRPSLTISIDLQGSWTC